MSKKDKKITPKHTSLRGTFEKRDYIRPTLTGLFKPLTSPSSNTDNPPQQNQDKKD